MLFSRQKELEFVTRRWLYLYWNSLLLYYHNIFLDIVMPKKKAVNLIDLPG